MREKFIEKYLVKIRGVSPLLQHRFSGDEVVARTKKSGQQYDNELLCRQALYIGSDGVIVQPAVHIEAAMIRSSANFMMKGKKSYREAFKGGIFVIPLMIPHGFQQYEMDLQAVVVNKSRIIRARPRFDTWELDFEVINIDERITDNILRDILEDAGRYIGIGDYRPRYGRFDVVSYERSQDKG